MIAYLCLQWNHSKQPYTLCVPGIKILNIPTPAQKKRRITKQIWIYIDEFRTFVVDGLPPLEKNGATKKTKHLLLPKRPQLEVTETLPNLCVLPGHHFLSKQPKKESRTSTSQPKAFIHSSFSMPAPPYPKTKKKLKKEHQRNHDIELPTKIHVNNKKGNLTVGIHGGYHVFSPLPPPGFPVGRLGALAPISTNWALEASVSASTRLSSWMDPRVGSPRMMTWSTYPLSHVGCPRKFVYKRLVESVGYKTTICLLNGLYWDEITHWS